MTVFVVDTSAQNLNDPCRAVLGYRNAISETQSGGYVGDSNYPLPLAFDYSYHTEYSPDLTVDAASVEITFTLSGVQNVSYFAIISKNAEESGLSCLCEVYDVIEADWVEVANFGSLTNGKPYLAYFGDQFTAGYSSATQFRLTMSYTSKPYIMAMSMGEAIVFPRTFSVGVQMGFAAYLDEVEQFYADDGLNLTIGRRIAKGKQFRGSLNFVKVSTIKEFYDEYANWVLDSKPLFLLWNSTKTDECFYGAQVPDKLTKPAYKNNAFAQIDFELIGWA